MDDALGIKSVRQDQNRDQISVTEHSRYFVCRISSNLAEQNAQNTRFA